MSRTSDRDSGPLYILNGLPAGCDCNSVNDALHMLLVEDIRIMKGVTERSFSGYASKSGIVEIRTL